MRRVLDKVDEETSRPRTRSDFADKGHSRLYLPSPLLQHLVRADSFLFFLLPTCHKPSFRAVITMFWGI
jgi:hypothetical protein